MIQDRNVQINVIRIFSFFVRFEIWQKLNETILAEKGIRRRIRICEMKMTNVMTEREKNT